MQIKGYSSFKFSGLMGYSNKDEEVIRTGKTKKGDKYAILRLSVKADSTTAFVEMMGIQTDTVRVSYKPKDAEKYEMKEFKKTEITEEILKSISPSFKYTAKLGPKLSADGKGVEYGEERVFVDGYEFIAFMSEKLVELKGEPVYVYGKPEVNVYNGKRNWKFRISGLIQLLPEKFKPECALELPLVFQKDSVDKIPDFEQFKELSPAERKLGVNAFATKYNSDLKKNELVPMDFKLNLSELNVEDVRTPTYLKIMKAMFETSGGRALSNKKYYQGVAICKYVSGRENAVEFTDQEKLMISVGMIDEATLLREKGAYGNRVTEVQITRLNVENLLEEVEIDEDADFFIEEKDTVVEANKNNEFGTFGL